jgi:transglutaminase-like putative cysteine protease
MNNQAGASVSTWRWLRPLASLPREKIDTLFLTATCALIMAPHGSHLPGWIVQVAIGLLLWRGWITFRGERLPPRWLLLPACLMVMAGVLLSYDTMLGRDTGVAMLVLLVAFKLLEMHARRDAFVVVFLSFFLILMNFFYSKSLLTSLLMGLAVVLVLTVQISCQYTRQAPPLSQRLRLAGTIVGMALPVMAVLFLLFPRMYGPFWGAANSSGGSGSTGLSQTMAPGNITRLALSSEVAFRVQFFDSVPPNPKLYWRGPVLGHFDGRNWSALPANSRTAPQLLRNGAPATRYQVTMEASGQNSIFVLEMPATSPWLGTSQALVAPDLQLLALQPVNQRLRYEAASFLDFQFGANDSGQTLRDWLQLPAGYNPRSQELAARLMNATRDPEQLASRVMQMFRDQPFRYTLNPPPLGQHSVDEFLFDTRAGFCEHFASAFVVLMRAMDIPSRVVTGYQGGELNALDGYMTVRQSDAHAWAEYWVPKRGWVRIDPTAAVAPARIESGSQAALPSGLLGGLVSVDADSRWARALISMRANWDALNNRWNQWVLDYSATRQKNLLQAMGFDRGDWKKLALLLAIALALCIAAVAFSLLHRRGNSDPVAQIYQQFCQLLARQGWTRSPHEGPAAFRVRLLSQAGVEEEKLRAWSEFLQLLETLRYAPPGVARDQGGLPRLKKLLALCR